MTLRPIPALITALSLLAASPLTAGEQTDSAAVAPRRVNIWHDVTGAAFGAGLTVGITEALKHGVTEWRPDRSDNRSFPSRHASWAYAGAAILSVELRDRFAYTPLLAQTAANTVGMQRVISRRHYPSDVLAGAAVGLLSVRAGYWLSDLIFNTSRRQTINFSDERRSSLYASTVAIIPLKSKNGDFALGTGIESAIGIIAPIAERFNIGAAAGLRSAPVYSHHQFVAPLSSLALRATAGYSIIDSRRWAVDVGASASLLHNFHHNTLGVKQFGAAADLSADAIHRLTDRISTGISAAIEGASIRGFRPSLRIALNTRVTL